MSVIDTPIPPQAFELIRDQLGAILSVELWNQFMLTGNYDLGPPFKVWRERLTPFDHTELPAANVMFAGSPFNNQDSKQAEGAYLYYVDLYMKSKASADSSPDTKAMVKLHRLIGICRAIIMDPRYKLLGFAAPFIGNRNITQVVIGDPTKMDATTAVYARLVVSVRVPETTALINPPQALDFLTTVRLSLTDKGYIWTGTST